MIFWNMSAICFAQIELERLYGLRDEKELRGFIEGFQQQKINVQFSDVEKLKMLGIAYHNLAVLKVKGASAQAVDCLQKAWSLSASDYETLAYLGSSMTMTARDSWNVLGKVSLANKGIKMIDDAVFHRPDSFVIRMVRARNSLDLPEFFSRTEVAKKDFLFLQGLFIKSNIPWDPAVEAEVFYELGMFFRRENNELTAKEYFQKAISTAPDSQWGKKSGEKLKR